MLISKPHKFCLFSCLLLIMPYLSYAQALDHSHTLNFSSLNDVEIQQNKNALELSRSHQSSDLDHSGPFKGRLKKKLKPLSLKDFVGPWILIDNSIGGVDGGIGKSLALDMQVVFDKHGNGAVNFFNVLIYDGTQDEARFSSFDKDEVQITIELIDRINGIGKITVEVTHHSPISANFIATRSLINGKVIKIEGINSSPETFNLRSFTMSRQNQ